MKKLLLFSLLLWQFNCELKAQAYIYHPFPSDSALWYETSSVNTPMYTRSLIKMLSDTVINNLNYNKLYIATSNYTNVPPPSSVPKNYTYLGGLREQAKKVYYIPASGNEKLLYDFTATIGDTIFFHPTNSSSYTITGIDSVALNNGKLRKTYTVQEASGVTNLGTIGKVIEGIGTEAGLLEIIILTVNSSQGLSCFSTGNQLKLYPAGPTGTLDYICPFSITVGISDLINNKITLKAMPNPTPDMVTLQLNCNSSILLIITNQLGQVMHAEKIAMSNEFSFDLSKFDNGVYFVTITDEEGNSGVKKIVKQ